MMMSSRIIDETNTDWCIVELNEKKRKGNCGTDGRLYSGEWTLIYKWTFHEKEKKKMREFILLPRTIEWQSLSQQERRMSDLFHSFVKKKKRLFSEVKWPCITIIKYIYQWNNRFFVYEIFPLIVLRKSGVERHLYTSTNLMNVCMRIFYAIV
jgi:hypothetical protein